MTESIEQRMGREETTMCCVAGEVWCFLLGLYLIIWVDWLGPYHIILANWLGSYHIILSPILLRLYRIIWADWLGLYRIIWANWLGLYRIFPALAKPGNHIESRPIGMDHIVSRAIRVLSCLFSLGHELLWLA